MEAKQIMNTTIKFDPQITESPLMSFHFYLIIVKAGFLKSDI